MLGIPKNGGSKLQHRVVSVAVADGIKVLLPADPKRLRALMFNSAATGSTVYVGDAKDVDGDDLAAANGWPLGEDRIVTLNTDHAKILANVHETFTKDAVYAMAVTATGTIKIWEELLL